MILNNFNFPKVQFVVLQIDVYLQYFVICSFLEAQKQIKNNPEKVELYKKYIF